MLLGRAIGRLRQHLRYRQGHKPGPADVTNMVPGEEFWLGRIFISMRAAAGLAICRFIHSRRMTKACR